MTTLQEASHVRGFDIRRFEEKKQLLDLALQELSYEYLYGYIIRQNLINTLKAIKSKK